MHTLTSLVDASAQLETWFPAKRNRHRMTLDHMRTLMAYLGDPQDAVKVVHVAGTSGKTSTAYYAAALLHAAGKRVGLTVSPHVASLNERVQIDMKPLPESLFCDELNTFLSLIEQGGFTDLTYFEVLCGFAYWQFVRQHVEYAVVEVGIGGLLDSTNVVTRADKVCILTDISFDHMSILGHTLSEIATQKAGIVQLHNSVFCWQQRTEIMEAFQRAARQKQADLEVLHTNYAPQDLSFLPPFQQRNFQLALHAVRAILRRDGGKLSPQSMQLAAHITVPARMEVFQMRDKTVIVDGSHNQQKIHALTEAIKAQYPSMPVTIIAAFTRSSRPEHRIDGGLKELMSVANYMILTSFIVDRRSPHPSLDPQVAARLCDAAGYNTYAVVPDPDAAFDAALARTEPIVVVTGSFFLLNHIRPLLLPAA